MFDCGQNILKGEDEQPEVMFHISVPNVPNDISKKTDLVVQK